MVRPYSQGEWRRQQVGAGLEGRSSRVARLEPGVVHVWRISLQGGPERVEACRGLLSVDERERADAFALETLRRRFVLGRGRQRMLLARYVEASPEGLGFEKNRYGKPAIAPAMNPGKVCFNVSNSHELALCAVTVDSRLGVDLEHLRPMNDADRIADRFFARGEAAELRAIPAADRLEAFFRCWTRKEAFLKAIGLGLQFDLDRVEVTLSRDEPARVLSIDGSLETARQWSMFALEPGKDYRGALVVWGAVSRVETWDWDEEATHGQVVGEPSDGGVCMNRGWEIR